MTRRITRAKQAIADSGVSFSVPAAEERADRVAAVRHVLYLIFTEGYAATTGPRPLRADLCVEAIRLTRLLRRLLPGDTETAGLLALRRFTDARRRPRRGPDRRGDRLVGLDLLADLAADARLVTGHRFHAVRAQLLHGR
jgi:predicted RNA polymerase sigma factor